MVKQFLKKILKENTYQDLREVKYWLARRILQLFWIFPIKNENILLVNFNGKGYGDNQKYIAEELHRQNTGKLIWLTNSYDTTMPSYVLQIKNHTLKAYYYIATAHIWIFNNRTEPFYVKRKKQYYIQTWHGSLGVKKVEADTYNLNEYYIRNAKRDSRMIDLMISDCDQSDKLFKDAFWYDGSVEKLGSPRIDRLFHDDINADIKKKFSINENDYVVLYAPTFRDSRTLEPYKFNHEKIINAFKLKSGKNVKLLFRLHPNLAGFININQDEETIIDVTSYPDVYDILSISNALITDYSSLMFEFPMKEHKPVFNYCNDLDTYNREFYFDLNSLPFSIAKNEDELCRNIINFDTKTYNNRINEFYKNEHLLEDGNSSNRVVEVIKHQLIV